MNSIWATEEYRNAVQGKKLTASRTGAPLEIFPYEDGVVSPKVWGKTEQNGTPTPSAPVDVVGVSGNIISTNGQESDSVALPVTLHSLGTADDSFDFSNGEHVKANAVLSFDGSEVWSNVSGNTHKTTIAGFSPDGESLCSHFANGTSYGQYSVSGNDFTFYSDMGLDDFKLWLAQQDSAETPVQVVYELATTDTQSLDAGNVDSYKNYTKIYSESVPAASITLTNIEEQYSPEFKVELTGMIGAQEINIGSALIKSCNLDDSCVAGGTISIGDFVGKRFELTFFDFDGDYASTIWDGAELTLTYSVKRTNGEYYSIVKGTFVIDESNEYEGVVFLASSDFRVKFDREFTGTIADTDTLYSALEDVCDDCSVVLGTASGSLPNATVAMTNGSVLNGLNCTEIVSYIAQACGRVAYIGSDDKLYLDWYGTSSPALAYDNSIISSGQKVSNGSITVTGIKWTEADGTIHENGTAAYVVSVENNPIKVSDFSALLTAIATSLVGFSYTPSSSTLKIFNPALETMDIISVQNRRGDTVSVPIMKISITGKSSQTIESVGEGAIKNAATPVSVTAAIERAKNQVAFSASAARQAMESALLAFNELMTNSMGYYETIIGTSPQIRYLHDAATLEASTNIYKQSSEGFAYTNSGGYPDCDWISGMTADGNILGKVLSVIGINADWINAGKISAALIELLVTSGNLVENSKFALISSNESLFQKQLGLISTSGDYTVKTVLQGWCIAFNLNEGFGGTGTYMTDYGWFRSYKTPQSFSYDPAEMVSTPIACQVGEVYVLSYYGQTSNQFNDLSADTYGLMLGLEFDTGTYTYYSPYNVFRTPIISGDSEHDTDSSLEALEPPFYLEAYDEYDEFYWYHYTTFAPTRYSVKFTMPDKTFVKSGTTHTFTGNVCIYLKDRRTSSQSQTLVGKIQLEKSEFITPYSPKDGEFAPEGISFTSNGMIVREGSTLQTPTPTEVNHAANKAYVDDNVPPAVSDYIDETVPPAVSNYIVSRGQNLVTNGTGLLGNNYNFSSFVFNGADAYSSAGSFVASSYTFDKTIDEIIPVDADLSYRMSYYIKANPYVGAKAYGYISCYDIDGLTIASQHCMYIANTLTTLADDLEAGDTVVKLTSAANYINSAGTQYWRRALIFWNYQNSYGYTYPESTYSRNVFQNLWADGGVNYATNEITLSAPWAGDTIPAGTKVSNGSMGGAYKYIAGNNFVIPYSWTKYSGTISGIDYSGTDSVTMFRPGTAFIKLGWLLNRDVAGSTSWLANVSFGVDSDTLGTSTKVGTAASVSSSAWTTVTFPTAFPAGSTVKVFVSIASAAEGVISAKVRNESATGFQVTIGGSGFNGISVNWQAFSV